MDEEQKEGDYVEKINAYCVKEMLIFSSSGYGIIDVSMCILLSLIIIIIKSHKKHKVPWLSTNIFMQFV